MLPLHSDLLASHRNAALDHLLAAIPRDGSRRTKRGSMGDDLDLYERIADYPRRPGKGLRAALCLATCRALGGEISRALPTAAAIELFHNGFLIHDDIQDGSERRRGELTLHKKYGVGVAINVGNASNLLGFGLLQENRALLGAEVAARLLDETEEMMRRTLWGQALELAWIRRNEWRLQVADYLRLCLLKTSWYTCLYPCRAGAAIAAATGGLASARERFDRYGWYLGAAFQIQDDLLNLIGEEERYGKEIGGDLLEGKRTLPLIHLLRTVSRVERQEIRRFLAKPRRERRPREVARLLKRMEEVGGFELARRASRQLAGGALVEALAALRDVPDSADKALLLALPLYVVERDR